MDKDLHLTITNLILTSDLNLQTPLGRDDEE